MTDHQVTKTPAKPASPPPKTTKGGNALIAILQYAQAHKTFTIIAVVLCVVLGIGIATAASLWIQGVHLPTPPRRSAAVTNSAPVQTGTAPVMKTTAPITATNPITSTLTPNTGITNTGHDWKGLKPNLYVLVYQQLCHGSMTEEQLYEEFTKNFQSDPVKFDAHMLQVANNCWSTK